ncbi:NUDIX domain-containing protein [Halorussus lipolyticus]|uniref:NUDIX domain-containing protein n=1 Tax=Halorussus lipolyticus TaxID=3034024 RepID=UPI0023E85434|nr:NUDIX domain-containing protein [Halorussus sp. DT80]
MPDTPPDAADAVSTDSDTGSLDSLADPEDLRDDDSVRFTHEEAAHDDRTHCNTDIAGRAVVGVTNDAGEVLLAVHEAESVAMLPHGEVESGDDWVAVARRKVELTTELPFEIDGVAVVREIDHFVGNDDEPHATTYGVVFRASLTGDPDEAVLADPGHPDNDHWDAGWFGSVPDNLPPGAGLVADDVRLFVD